MDNTSNKSTPLINIDDTPQQTTRVRKQKGWGHWNSFVKSKEYIDLRPGNIQITEDELARHNQPDDLWIALSHEGRVIVYDVTLFAEYHPGGYEIIEGVAGRDATEDFRVAHAYVNPNMIAKFQKGFLIRTRFASPNSLSPGRSILPPVKLPSSKLKPKWDWTETGQKINFKVSLHKILSQKLNNVTLQCTPSNLFKLRIFFETEYYYFEIQLNEQLTVLLDTLSYNEEDKSISIEMKNSETFQLSHLGGVIEDAIVSLNDSFDKEEYFPCTLVCIRDLNIDCREFTFKWPFWMRVGVPMGHHIMLKAEVEGDQVQRPYTPVCLISTDSSDNSLFNQTTVMIKRYSDGKMSSYLHSLDEDSIILMSLPLGSFKSPLWITSQGTVVKSPELSNIESVVMIAAGSGITPMIRLLLSCLSKSDLNVHLLFFNRKRSDIIYKDEFQALQRFFEPKLKVSFFLSQPDSDWCDYRGRISEECCRELLSTPFSTKLYLICGPSGFNKTALKICGSLKVSENQIHEFKG